MEVFNMKKIFIAAFLFIFATTTNAFAHTHLGSSTPENGEVVTEELSEITLTFEGKIEQSSSFKLSDSEGQEIPIETISINEEIMTGTLAAPLENGEYVVNSSIIGADGHLIEEEISFTVNLAETATSTEATNDTQQSEQDTTEEVEQNSDQAASETVAEETESNEESSTFIPVIIIVLLVVVIGAFLMMRRKK